MGRLFALAVIAFAALAATLAAPRARAESSFSAWGMSSHARASIDDPTTIMRPEQGRPDELPLPPKRRRGSSNPVYPAPLPQPDHFNPLPPLTARPGLPTVQPYVVSPQTGRALPNLDQGQPEMGQDRAMRCAHQSGMYGETGGSYLGACINQ